MRRKLRFILFAAAIPVALALIPTTADAQRARGGAVVRAGGGAAPHAVAGGAAQVRGGGAQVRGGGGVYTGGSAHVIHGGGYWGGYWGGWWGPYWGWGYWWDPLWYGPFWGYPYYPYYYRWGPGYYDNSAELRLEVRPKEAQVYVDGYYAGIVDDFNGVFQRLHIRPGRHELAIYLPGFRTVRQNLYLTAGQDSKVRFDLVALGPGEQNEPPPQPVNPPAMEEGYGNQGQPPTAVQPGVPRPARPARPAPQAPAAPVPPAPPAPPEGAVEQGQGFGSLVIRVQPSGADVVIDGERWQGPEGSERLVVQVSEGSHRIEIRKEGFVPFSTTVTVRSGATAPINVSLPPRQ